MKLSSTYSEDEPVTEVELGQHSSASDAIHRVTGGTPQRGRELLSGLLLVQRQRLDLSMVVDHIVQ